MASSLEVLNLTSATGVELGRGAVASGANAIAAGAAQGNAAGTIPDPAGAFATAAKSIAVGAGANATAAGAVQLGEGTNSTANSLQFQDTRIPTETQYNALVNFLDSGILVNADLAISATAEKFKTTATAYYFVDGYPVAKAAEDNLVFSAAYTINAATGAGALWGAFLVQGNKAGTISTKAAAADQVYETEDEAVAALPAADAGNTALGYIVVNANDGADWTANTDDMTDASDCLTTTFHEIAESTLPATI